MSETTGTRSSMIDVLKGTIIIAVVFLHIGFSKHDDVGSPGILIQAMYLGLMAFFIISGYFCKPERGFVCNMKKRVKQLLIILILCAVVLPVIQFCWLCILGQAPDLDDFVLALQWGFGLNELFMPLGSPKVYPLCGSAVGYYFIWAMLFAFVIFYAFIGYVIDSKKKLAAMILILLAITVLECEFCRYRMPFYLELAPLSSAFMFAGAGLAKFNLIGKIEGLLKGKKESILLLAISLICGAVLLLLFPPGINFDILLLGDHGGLSTLPYFLESVFMCIVFLYISSLVSKIPVLLNILTEAGKHTLGILMYHGFVASMIIATFCPLTTTSWFPADLTMAQRIPLAFGTLIICYVICKFGPAVVTKVTNPILNHDDKM